MALAPQLERALKGISTLYGKNPGVQLTYIGYKYMRGQRTDIVSVVVGVEKKISLEHLAAGERIPAQVAGIPTDVQQVGILRGPAEPQDLKPLENVARVRPSPGGVSVGHFAITAGTLGLWVKRGGSDRFLILSNNHVLANSNQGTPGDAIYQPGPYDGGTAQDRIAVLTDYVTIRFDSGSGSKKKDNAITRAFWGTAKAVPNSIARAFGCPYRLQIIRPNAITQPYPNLVDAAVATAISDSDALPEILGIGAPVGVRDFILGDRVQKVGRTSAHTFGLVEGVFAIATVNYGPEGNAAYSNQNVIRGEHGVEFSAPGDSGSAILTADGYLGGLLFAGGENITLGNRVSDVFSLLGLRLP